MKAIVNSRKHIVQTSLATIQEQTILTTTIALVVDAQPTTSIHVVAGAVIKAVWLEYWLLGEASQECTATWTVEKLPNLNDTMTQAEGQDLDNYINKKNILKMGQGIIGEANSNPIPVIREWVKIPKGKQRFGLGDALVINISCIGSVDNGLQICGFALYKEYQ